MVMTKAGGVKVRETIEKKYGRDFWKKIGAIGGKKGGKKGFALDHERAVAAGRKGGKKSTRLGVKNGEGKKHNKVD